MTFEYFPDTDTLYIALREGQSADTAEVERDLLLDYDVEGHIIGLTIEHASERADLTSISLSQMPPLGRAA